MMERQRAIGIFNNSSDTEAALKELDSSHFSLDRVSVIARNPVEEDKVIGTQLCESLRNRFDTKIGSDVQQNSNASESKTISLTKALTHLDIPVDTASSYNDLVEQGKYLVMVEGSQEDISGAKTILKRCSVRDWVVYKIALEHPEVIIVDRRDIA